MGDADLDWLPIEPKDAGAWSAMLIDIQHADRDWEFLTEITGARPRPRPKPGSTT